MKKNFLLTVLIIMFAFPENIEADCASCDGYLDTGRCDKSDINNKFCVWGSNRDCYMISCNDDAE